MACRSVAYNGLEDRVEIVTGDIKEAGTLFDRASFDVVTSNPPYMMMRTALKIPRMPRLLHAMRCSAPWRTWYGRGRECCGPEAVFIWYTGPGV